MSVAAKTVAGNKFAVYTEGVSGVHLWLARGMIDFDKPVGVHLNFKELKDVTVKPSLNVLMEDFFERGDRQQLYLARIDVK